MTNLSNLNPEYMTNLSYLNPEYMTNMSKPDIVFFPIISSSQFESICFDPVFTEYVYITSHWPLTACFKKVTLYNIISGSTGKYKGKERNKELQIPTILMKEPCSLIQIISISKNWPWYVVHLLHCL